MGKIINNKLVKIIEAVHDFTEDSNDNVLLESVLLTAKLAEKYLPSEKLNRMIEKDVDEVEK